MKKLLTVVVILLVVVAGVVLGVMQPWKKDGDAQKSDGNSTPQESASAKEPDGNDDSQGSKAPKNPSATTNDKLKTRTIPTRRVPTRSVPAEKTDWRIACLGEVESMETPTPRRGYKFIA